MEKKEKKPDGYWTYDKCKEEAQKYGTLNEFHKNSCGAYAAARRNGWLDNLGIERLFKSKHWTYEECYEEAIKYTTRGEFAKGSKNAYQYAVKKKWLDDYTWFAPSASAKKFLKHPLLMLLTH